MQPNMLSDKASTTSPSHSYRNIHIIDAVAALPHGHNIPCLNRYADLYQKLYPDSTIFKHASSEIENIKDAAIIKDIFPTFTFLYEDILPLMHDNNLTRGRSKCNYPTPIRLPLHSGHPQISEIIESHTCALEKAKQEAQAFLESYSIAKNDLIVFPGADFYGLHALLSRVLAMEPRSRPSLVIKFISVSEFWTALWPSPFDELMKLIKRLVESDTHVRILTEAPEYSKMIDREYKMFATCAPMPMEEDITKNSRSLLSSNRVVLFPGSQRPDKGAARIPSIISYLNQSIGLKNVSFILQLPHQKHLKDLASAYKEIMRWPNVGILPASISNKDLRNLYRQSRIICLPYCEDTYSSFRSSASYVEAAYHGRPVVASRCPGFAETIERFSLGYISSNTKEMCDHIRTLLDHDPRSLAEKQLNCSRIFAEYITCSHRIFSLTD